MSISSAAHLLFILPPHAADAPSIPQVFIYVVLTGIPMIDETAVQTSDAVSDATADVPSSPPVSEDPVLSIIRLPPERHPMPIIREHTRHASTEGDAAPVSEHRRNKNFCPS